MAPAYPEAQRHQGAPPDVRRGSILCSPLQVITRGWLRDLFLSAHAAPPCNFLDKSSIDIVNALAPTSAGAQLM